MKTQLDSSITRTKSSQANIGDLMVIIEPRSPYYRHIVLKIFERFVSLTNPTLTWNNPNFEVRFLSPGETVTLTQE